MNRFFLRCCPKVVGSLEIGKLRVQTGATSVRGRLKRRSQKGNIAHTMRSVIRSYDLLFILFSCGLFLFVNEPCGSTLKRMTSRIFIGDVWSCQNRQMKNRSRCGHDRLI